MDISVIIVNYNVKFFLEQCIRSVKNAVDGLRVEIIVVDNHSVDGSVALIKEKFPDVVLIENKQNVGFSKANNQGIKIARGKYVLLLNPDTVIQEDTLVKCFNFMEQHSDAGALGVKMFDGKGNFLPESKRGLPTPMVAFYKIFGLSKLFPKSKIFGKYHLTYLDKNQNHIVDVLSGAFMFIRKEVLDKIGGLDEDYFMYGEDIDLSYRITKAGYKNYYFAETSIIHYKGESTKKSSVNYVITFYKAMQIFADKHFSNSYAKFYNALIFLAIYLRAGMSIVYRFVKSILIPLLDVICLFVLIVLFSFWYEKQYKYSNYYDRNLLYASALIYSLIIIVNIFFQGGYEKHPKYKNVLQGNVFGFLIILSLYSLLPENLRFSRGIILMGGVIAVVYFTISRWLFFYIGLKKYSYLSSVLPKNILIVGDEEEFERVKKILENMPVHFNYIGLVKTSKDKNENHPAFSGYLQDVEEIIHIEKIDEIIFCSKHLNVQEIIEWMIKLSYLPVHYKIAHPNELYIIGSNDIHNQGELYSLEFKTILLPENQRKKRLLDILLSVFVIVSLPLTFIFYKSKSQVLKNIFDVLMGRKTWIGLGKYKDEHLPKLKPSVLFIGKIKGYDERSEKARELSYIYCKNYQPINDVWAFFKLFNQLDNA